MPITVAPRVLPVSQEPQYSWVFNWADTFCIWTQGYIRNTHKLISKSLAIYLGKSAFKVDGPGSRQSCPCRPGISKNACYYCKWGIIANLSTIALTTYIDLTFGWNKIFLKSAHFTPKMAALHGVCWENAISEIRSGWKNFAPPLEENHHHQCIEGYPL